MNKRKMTLLFLLVFLLLLLSACQSILFQKDKPTSVKEKKQVQAARITEYQYLTAGIVQCYDPVTDSLLVTDRSSSAPASNAISIYDQNADNKLSNLVLSDKIHNMVRYDKVKKGIYYLQQESTADNRNTGTGNQQLIWTSLDKSITETVSDPTHSVSSPFCFFDEDKVLYANNKNEIIVIGHDRERSVYKNIENHQISQLAYDPELNTMIYIGQTPKDEKKVLYMARMDEKNLEPAVLASDVLHFDYNQKTGTLAYIQEADRDNKLYTYNLRDAQPPLLLYKGELRRVFIASDDSGIFFTRTGKHTEKPLEAIYHTDLLGKNIKQITSPLNLASPVVINPKKQNLYFSIENPQSADPTGNKMIDLYLLHYQLNENKGPDRS